MRAMVLSKFPRISARLSNSLEAADIWRLARFSLVGVAVALIYAGLFLALRAWVSLSEAYASLLAFAVAVAFQYLAQTIWTFRSPLNAPGQIGRFTTTILIGAATSTLITSVLGPALGASDAVSAAIVVVWLPVQNFALFSLWVYARNGADE